MPRRFPLQRNPMTRGVPYEWRVSLEHFSLPFTTPWTRLPGRLFAYDEPSNGAVVACQRDHRDVHERWSDAVAGVRYACALSEIRS